MIDGQLIEVVGGATAGGRVDESADRTSQRILDAAFRKPLPLGCNGLRSRMWSAEQAYPG